MAKKRSLTLKVTKTLSGDMAEGYPRTYYGMQAFSYNGTDYPAIDAETFSMMAVSLYQSRLSAFIAYVELQEFGLNISEVQTNEPYY
ncbi:hypothetical protein [Limibacterium fermenti]|uniref:hypothetical protein n=1 Tax=Limibacterium fermenti TaxID=3229863 RepID=UPI000E9383F1|nr:hypothetical protein [Porphyromonadaceae bacterium]